MIMEKVIEYAPGAEIKLAVPPEPEPGAVVIDRFGRAWQRLAGNLFGACWHPTGKLNPLIPQAADIPPLTWGALLLRRGMVTLVYTPPAKEAK